MAAPVIPIDQGNRRGRVIEARRRLIKAHVELVPPIAEKIKEQLPPSFDLGDLIGAGNLGLVIAAKKYRPGQHGGCPFSAFARHRIRGAILDSVRRRHYTENTRPSIEDIELAQLGAETRSADRHRQHLVDGDTRRLKAAATIPRIDEDLDRSALLKRLKAALGRLSARQKALLDKYYAEDADSLERAYWRRRKRVSEMHAEIIDVLRKELAS